MDPAPSAILPFAALHAPVANYTWELRADLASTAVETGRVRIEWNRPVRIVGIYPSIIDTADETQLSATLDDITCLLDSNQRETYTARLDRSTVQTAGDEFVTLAALGVTAPRLLLIDLKDPAPDMGVNFRFERGANVYNSCRIKLAFYCNYL
jgi:hypothetical protein